MRYTKQIGFEDIRISLIAVWKNINKCVIAAVAFFAIGLVLTFSGNIENYYSSSTKLYCIVNGDYSVTSSAAEALSSYAPIINSQKVAERTVSILGNTNLTYRDVQRMVSYSVASSGMSVTISANSSYPDEAMYVANAAANAFVEEMRNITGMDAVKILSEATTANLSNNGLLNLWMNRIVFFAAGFAIMALFIFAKELFSDKIRSIEQCKIVDEDVILGIIPDIEELKK